MGSLSGFASWIVKGLLMATFLGLYWFYRPPQNPVESIMGASFCIVSAWLVVKILGWCFRSGGE